MPCPDDPSAHAARVRAPVTRAVLSLGSNLGDRLAHLQLALDGLGPAVQAVSPVFQTAPWGPVAQDDYLNAIVVVDDPAADSAEWLRRGQLLEQRAGRTRTVRFGPRTLDVDVITVDGVRSDDPRLTLPHPRAHERAFVLVPWLAVSPGASLPRPITHPIGTIDAAADGQSDRITDLVAGLPPDELAGVRRRDDLALSLPGRPVTPRRDPSGADR
jgi:2-amino-4-hydroxy-6-hydroxymethyldihydropteridine diphosphokinase